MGGGSWRSGTTPNAELGKLPMQVNVLECESVLLCRDDVLEALAMVHSEQREEYQTSRQSNTKTQ